MMPFPFSGSNSLVLLTMGPAGTIFRSRIYHRGFRSLILLTPRVVGFENCSAKATAPSSGAASARFMTARECNCSAHSTRTHRGTGPNHPKLLLHVRLRRCCARAADYKHQRDSPLRPCGLCRSQQPCSKPVVPAASPPQRCILRAVSRRLHGESTKVSRRPTLTLSTFQLVVNCRRKCHCNWHMWDA